MRRPLRVDGVVLHDERHRAEADPAPEVGHAVDVLEVLVAHGAREGEVRVLHLRC